MDIFDKIKAYHPYNEQEAADKEVILKYFEIFDNVYERSNRIGHVTCSPWIINKANTHVLMIYHNIYQSWGWCGGHSDGNRDILNKALEEGKEETGLQNLIAMSDDIFSIEVLPVKSHVKHSTFVSAHMHLNFTFLCMADEHETLHMKPDENSGVEWIRKDDINKIVREEDMKPIYQKLIAKTDSYFHNNNHKMI